MTFKSVCLTSILALAAGQAMAEMNFNRISSFATPLNNADQTAQSSAEIIAASDDGMTLVYTDSPLGVVGLINITDPKAPKAKGSVALEGEPTSVTVIGNTAFVGVNTSESYTNPSGKLVSVNLADGSIMGECDLGGQPDSTAHTDAGDTVVVAIENERDEDFGNGRVGQQPAGYMVTVGIANEAMDCATLKKIDVTGLTEIAPEDPEPEFVDVNANGEIAVTLQENNAIIVLNADGSVQSQFSAGSVDLEGIDATDERGALVFTESQPARLREPDGLQWIDNDQVMIANEGDMDGGSRSITVFHKDGTLVWESGNAFETPIIQAGHYPDKRSDAKGVEPEGMEIAKFGEVTYAFILSERASTISVYDVTDAANPVFKQVLPSGISPEGAIAIPKRGLLATANEVDLGEDGGARAHVMIYELQDAPAAYPQLTSEGADELIGWGAISGMVADENGMIYAVNDSFYGFQPRIFTIDPSQTPARIIAATDVTRAGHAAQKLDMEGITLDGEGGYWIASEGRTDRLVPHALLHVNSKGEIKEEIALPAELLAVETRFGFEGITKVGDTLWMAVQREWADDAAGFTKLVAYNTDTKEWGAVLYPLDAVEAGWIGLSEIQVHGDYVYLIERDNQIGAAAKIKQVTRVALSEMVPATLGGELPVVTKEVVHDLIPDLAAQGGYIVDKIEGMAIMEDGTIWMSTDNDGVDDSSGETFFWSIGQF
ncbi:esterase-like activity of phytase family protein [Marivivens sp. LCG002]|uniref:esterase-like activity of phytase family protein n=1 Tax=Marivivens sp. LCG002 TaxID=3051171 RepID=UPI0025548A0E|nr:esterase-like activity of phytase family protein [Marivivens sp. LCG002]WIV49702.1 esterase-like activity of phytase family protein [Marivivens sp. LCG002]